jgi:predicted transcriptional regulator
MTFKARFEMRVTPTLMEQVRRAAKWKDITPSTFVRDAIREKVERTKEEWRRWKAGLTDNQTENASDL